MFLLFFRKGKEWGINPHSRHIPLPSFLPQGKGLQADPGQGPRPPSLPCWWKEALGSMCLSPSLSFLARMQALQLVLAAWLCSLCVFDVA